MPRALIDRVQRGPTDDVVGDRRRLIEIGMMAVFVACVVFGAVRLATQLATGLLTPWWGNALAAVLIAVLYAATRGERATSSLAVHGSAVIATIALLIPAAYGMTSSKWWLSLVGFSTLLMGRRSEAITWTVITVILVPLTAIVEPMIVVEGAIGEPVGERALAGFMFVTLLLGVTWAFRRVAQQRAKDLVAVATSLDRAIRVRSRFLAHMSHDFRTPLHGVIAMTDLAMRGNASPEVLEQVNSAQESALVLLGLLNNVLDVTRAEADAIELEARPFSLHDALGDVVRPIAAQARARGIDVVARAEPGIVASRIGDRVRVVQIVLNLLGNALKFTTRGTITLRLRETAPDRIEVDVVDTGRGVAKENLDSIFEAFTQSDAADARMQAGAGLGLAIVRELARRMDGSVRVESELGRGSTFTVSLRLPREDGAREAGPEDLLGVRSLVPPGADESSGAPLEILVCDDDALSRRILGVMLTRLGHRVTVVDEAQKALTAIEGHAFDLLLTDVEMPRMDGLELTRRVRQREATLGSGHLWVMAATAHVGEDEQHRLLAAGVDAHLPKPFVQASLVRALAGVPRARAAPAA